jgi:hypothetical protein
MRTALASKNVWEWVDELSEWSWPSEGGSAGFQQPNPTRKKLFLDAGNSASRENDSTPYIGCLRVQDVARYEKRIDEIHLALEHLAVEEIKNHVMTNHIMPLSRPTTPITDARRTKLATLATFNRMEDITAVITAIVVQTLPNMARLSQLLQIWSIRVRVLQAVPSVLLAMEEAEVALRSGWNAISWPSHRSATDDEVALSGPSLARKDFLIMKLVIENKVSKPGRSLDYMLDLLEGMPDTLPNEWLDRMEVIERDYGEWVAMCERRIRETEWIVSRESRKELRPLLPANETAAVTSLDADEEASHPLSPVKESPEEGIPASEAEFLFEEDASRVLSPVMEMSIESPTAEAYRSPSPTKTSHTVEQFEDDIHSASPEYSPSPSMAFEREYTASVRNATRPQGERTNGHITLPAPEQAVETEEPSKASRDARKPQPAEPTRKSKAEKAVVPQEELGSDPERALKSTEPAQDAPGLDGARDGLPSTQVQPPSLALPTQSFSYEDYDDDSILPNEDSVLHNEHIPDDGEEPELPLLRDGVRRGSDESQTSTIIHGASSHFAGLSSDPPEISASPDIARARVRQAEYIDSSPPSSPPLPEADTREASVAPTQLSLPDLPRDMTRESSLAPTEGSIQEESFYHQSMAPKTPVDESFTEFDDDSYSISEMMTPSRRESTSDQNLRKQISDIIDSIPAKIKLATEPPNLNPPDLQLPKLRKKPSKEPFKRSTSSMSNASTRTSTPSFTLAPARHSRARHNRSQQEIKVYHLSRSTGEAPIKLFIRCVGENGERVMVRVGGGWADLSEYLKEYASHHGRRSEKAKVEVRDAPRVPSRLGGDMRSSPPSRPASALDGAPMTPLAVRKARRSMGATGSEAPRLRSGTPGPMPRGADDVPSSEERGNRSRSNSRMSWVEEDSSFLGLAGPSSKRLEMSDENKAWVESVKEKVRLASGERRVSGTTEENRNKFGELGKVGGTKRLFPKKGDNLGDAKR